MAEGFTCEIDEKYRSACKDFPKYPGTRYCVLHYPGEEKEAPFQEALKRKYKAGDYNFDGAYFPSTDTSEFRSFEFKGDVSFREATFSGDAFFEEATFSGDASFQRATFSRWVMHQCWHVRTSYNDAAPEEAESLIALLDDQDLFRIGDAVRPLL